ncbi:tetratricopeptide repeat protein [Emcibacter sp. SYSU 3D8]|uniref:tetratricopeptide repeat protein n=1 Tax=Emcibacter sp. SYSU 3D8 TaxID=3133969 RepID=UPI0031FF014A
MAVALLTILAIAVPAAGSSAEPAPVPPPEHQDRTIRIAGQSPDPAYGYDREHPILLGGMAERDFDRRAETYFSLLFAADGQPLKVLLNETCCRYRAPDSGETLSLQVIEAGADGKRPFRFYVNGFKSGALYAPRGLLATRSEENAEMVRGALDNLRAGFTDGAMQALRPLAQAGDALAQYQMGRVLADRKDFEGAYGWFLKAANNGHSVSQAAVAAMLETGNGVAADKQAALKWRRQAAANGHTGSLMAFALSDLSGKSDMAAMARAASMLHRAAELGDPAAQAAYGLMLVQGRGVPRDNFQGLVWLLLARQAGDANAKAAYVSLAASQTAQTIARVEQTASEWSNRRSPPPAAAVPDK